MTKAAESKRSLVRDPEAIALDKIAAILNGLEPPARSRTLAWINSRYAAEKLQPGEQDGRD